MTLRGARRFRIEARAIRETEEVIRAAGQDGYELFVVWSGTRDVDTFTVDKVHVPEQDFLQARHRTLREDRRFRAP